jgi:acetoacetyl-CoA reductase
MFDLSGQNALVTGASGGIGGAIARALHQQGATVLLAGTREAALTALAAEFGERAHILTADLSQPDEAERLVREAEAALGQIDILVNNAGITRDAMFHRMTPEHWNAVIGTNLSSLFNMCRPVIEGMRSRKFGRIVNVSSINGQKGQMGQTNYSAAKAGDIGFTKALAQENAKVGITVNAICPGYINTEMVQAVPKDVLEKNILPLIPVGRLGEPEEVARCVVFLASDDAGFITGSTMTVNGAQYIT